MCVCDDDDPPISSPLVDVTPLSYSSAFPSLLRTQRSGTCLDDVYCSYTLYELFYFSLRIRANGGGEYLR